MANSTTVQVNRVNTLTTNIHPLFWVAGLLLALWFTPAPEGLTVQTWHLFGIFVTAIVGIILNAMPMGALAILALSLCTITSTLTIKQSLSSFSSHTVWLILIAFLLARGFIKTGLGARIAYYFVLNMGKSTIGLGYGLITTEFLLAPFTPSNTARGAGIVYPIVSALSQEYKSNPKDGTARKMGSYLIKLAYQANVITSAMFLTAMVGNPLIANLALQHGIEITWTTWAMASIVPGVLSLAALPWVLYLFYPPEIKKTPEAPQFAKQKLAEMGPLRKEEWFMLGTFALLLTLWVLGSTLKIDPTVAALLGLSILLCSGVLTWDDILKEQNAWHTFIWLATLLMMSTQLTELGMMTWFSHHMQSWVGNLHWLAAIATIVLIYFYSHYAFASITAHITSLYSAFAVVAIGAGAPVGMTVLLLAYFSSLCAGITHYGTGCAPVYFGTEYVSLKDWWRLGGIVSLINIAIWAITGPMWWKVLGFW